MHVALPLLALAAGVLLVAALARRWGMSAPLLLTAVGAIVSFIPAMPAIEVEPEVILLGLLPPLLYAAASQSSLLDLKRDKSQIFGLSVLLVLFTAACVALAAWKLLGLPFAVALALGGIVAPPDAVAATAVARRIGLPRRVVSILEGESLFNDATALVTVRTAVGLATATALTASIDFARAAVGGVLIGLAVFWVLKRVQRLLTDVVSCVALSFMTPWLAYIPAELVHASGVIAVVVCGVLLADDAPRRLTATTRIAERFNWATVQFLLENVVFLLIGLHTATIVSGIRDDLRHSLLAAAVVFLVVLAARPIGILTWEAIRRAPHADKDTISFRESVITSWAGMRGVVTLAAAFVLPHETPHRELVIFIALVVTVGTLALQGFTLGSLARRLDLHGPDPREDALQLAQVMQHAVNAGTTRLAHEIETATLPIPAGVVDILRSQSDRRANVFWERLGSGEAHTSPTAAYRNLRLAMLDAERAKVLTLRQSGIMDHEVISDAMLTLDIEESMISRAAADDETQRDRVLLTPEVRRGGCVHLQSDQAAPPPSVHDHCVECEKAGQQAVQLRMCLTCGNVACCDSSEGQHATKHFKSTGHPVMRSFEPGEAWRWCYIDHQLG